MKKGIKVFIALFVILVLILFLFFSAVYIFVNTEGKVFLTQKLEDVLKRKVNIDHLELKIPLVLEIKGFAIENIAYIEHIYITPSLFRLLSGKIVINELRVLNPEVNWEILTTPAAKQTIPDVSGTALETITINKEHDLKLGEGKLSQSKKEDKQSDYNYPIIIRYLIVKDGIINFKDRTISKSGIQITLKGVSANIDNLYLFPESVMTNFQLRAKIPWQDDSVEGTVYVSGWIDVYKKNMQARLEIEDIDAVYLYPYYSNWVDLENSLIKEAKLNFISDIKGENNDVVAKCRLELTDIQFRSRPEDQPEHKAEKITTAVLGIFRALNQGKVILNFTIKTKMDNPKLNFGLINQAVDKTLSQAIKSDKVKIDDVSELPGQFFEDMSNKATGVTKAIIDGAVAAGKDLKDAILDAFKTEEESEESVDLQEELFGD